jgi:hypothetical protein
MLCGKLICTASGYPLVKSTEACSIGSGHLDLHGNASQCTQVYAYVQCYRSERTDGLPRGPSSNAAFSLRVPSTLPVDALHPLQTLPISLPNLANVRGLNGCATKYLGSLTPSLSVNAFIFLLVLYVLTTFIAPYFCFELSYKVLYYVSLYSSTQFSFIFAFRGDSCVGAPIPGFGRC